jgi:O-antigen biosynthesis protein WbqV
MNAPTAHIDWTGLLPDASQPCDLSPFEPIHRDRSVLVTGAGGSIGTALARAIHSLHPRTLLLLDSSEQNLYYIHRELSPLSQSVQVIPVIASVADPVAVQDVFHRFQPEVIYHAAALKHVPLGEMNPFAVVETNIFGTSVLATFALQFGADVMLMISTDKSVAPHSIMGASKAVAEMITLRTASNTGIRMTSIRLGNVLGSEGSVVPLFLQQIAHGGPLTVTDPNIERYFLSMEATVCRVLIAAATVPPQPVVAVPSMGKAVKIIDLARYMLQELGASNVPIEFTGLRPGDKLIEQFVASGESLLPDSPEGLQWLRSQAPSREELATGLNQLADALQKRDLENLLSTLTQLVPNYKPSTYLLDQATSAAD